MECARLTRYGLLSVSGDDARAFLHAQLTKDIENLPPERAALAGWCSAKGRLLASFLVIPAPQGFLLQLARDIAPGVARKLSMFVLRAKVRIADVSESWEQFGVWGDGANGPADPNGISHKGSIITVHVGDGRYLVLGPAGEVPLTPTAGEERWTLQEIRAGRPLITAATQDKFVPQMVNFDELGAVDFRKGCYPGQEIVARAQYRGQVKRRMVGAHAPAGVELRPGQEFNGGTVIDVAPAENGSELLAVMPI
ncbi:MAG TPA: folate-binding protein [Burkholderiales bacterium]|nr:folate-binding protein [Burkholderiales bacterium]